VADQLSPGDKAALLIIRQHLRNARERMEEAVTDLHSAQAMLAILKQDTEELVSASWERGMVAASSRTLQALRSELNRISLRLRRWL